MIDWEVHLMEMYSYSSSSMIIKLIMTKIQWIQRAVRIAFKESWRELFIAKELVGHDGRAGLC